MFDFNKPKGDESAPRDESTDYQSGKEPGTASPSTQGRSTGSTAAGRREAAVIGPSIHIDGDLRGEEDLIIEGEVKGTVHLKHNGLTIGSQGKVTADVYAHTINVDGLMQGDLYAAERVSIRKTAEVHGNITSPRVSLEDGARFKGSIEMDPEAEALQKAFADKGPSKSNVATSSFGAKQASTGNSGSTSTAGSSVGETAVKGGSAG